VASGDDLYALLDLANRDTDAISVNSTIASQDGTVLDISNNFQIQATATGGATAVKDVNAKIIVCGSEALTLTSDAQLVIDKQVADTAYDYYVYEGGLVALFSSDDSDCPAITFTITTTNDTTVDGATLPASEEFYKLDVVNTTEPAIWLNPDTIGEYQFYLAGETVSAAYTYKDILMSVTELCDEEPQVISLADDATDYNYYNKNQGELELFTEEEMVALFVLDTHASDCLIQTYEILHSPNETVVADTDELYAVLQLATRTGFGLNFTTDIVLTDGTVLDYNYNFTILATA
jgi:hypothetical protein